MTANPPLSRPAPSTRLRVAFALAVGLACGTYVLAFGLTNPDFTSDFDQAWGGAVALLHGQNPYDVVGPGKQYPWSWPLYYPLPALLIVAPLGLLPVLAARVVFAALSAALVAFGISRDGFARWPLFISISFVTAVELCQWSNLQLAAMLLPALGWVAVAKPNIGVAMAVQSRTDRAVAVMLGGSAFLVAISFLVMPDWPRQWLDNVRSAPHFRSPLTRPGGFLILLALLRWRRPEARLLVALAVIPQTPGFYDHVLVFSATKTFREALTLSALTLGVFFAVVFLAPERTLAVWGEVVGRLTILLVYLPALVMILRRPNEGELPRSVARLLAAVMRRPAHS
jgi:hypothetical protein